MTERIHLGHSLTRLEAARRAGIAPQELALRPDLLRIGSHFLPEVYFEFQFDGYGIRPDLADVVRSLHSRHDDLTIADWLARPNEELGGSTPIQWATSGGDRRRLMGAASRAGPVSEEPSVPVSPKASPSSAPPTPRARGRSHRQWRAGGRRRRVGAHRVGPTPAA